MKNFNYFSLLLIRNYQSNLLYQNVEIEDKSFSPILCINIRLKETQIKSYFIKQNKNKTKKVI